VINPQLAEIATAVASGAHAILLLDQARWRLSAGLEVPENITILPLPPKSPELNPVKNLWQFIRDNFLSNRIFTSCPNNRRSSLLKCLEPNYRPALENHVHRPTRLGTRVLNIAS